MEFEIWIYRALIGIALVILWWIVQRWANQISTKLDDLIAAMNIVAQKNIEQEVRIGMLEKRVSDHSIRIRQLEKLIK